VKIISEGIFMNHENFRSVERKFFVFFRNFKYLLSILNQAGFEI
jgi:hypothetical protein